MTTELTSNLLELKQCQFNQYRRKSMMKTAILFSLVLIAVSLNYAFAANPYRSEAEKARLEVLGGRKLESTYAELYDFKDKPEQNKDIDEYAQVDQLYQADCDKHCDTSHEHCCPGQCNTSMRGHPLSCSRCCHNIDDHK